MANTTVRMSLGFRLTPFRALLLTQAPQRLRSALVNRWCVATETI